MGIGNVGRAFLLGTSALVMTSTAAVAADFDITGNTAANHVLGAGETGTVQVGATLSQSDAALPTVDILGSGATLTNLGTISGIGPALSGVRATGPIVGVSVTNSGTISGFRAAFGATAGADISGGVANQVGGTFAGSTAGIGVFTGANISGGVNNTGSILGGVTGIEVFKTSDISGGVDNSGTVFGGTIGISVNAPGVTSNPSDISGGVLNQTGGAISGGVTGVRVDIISKISGGIHNRGIITGVRNQGTISHTGMAIAVAGAGADITGQGVVNEVVATLSGGVAGLSVAGGANFSGGVDNSGLVKGGVFGFVLNNSDISGGVLNQAGGTISGGSFGIRLANMSDVSGGVDNSGTISGLVNGISVALRSDISGGVLNQAGGTISASATGFTVFGIQVSANAKISGGIDNSGTITGVHNQGTISRAGAAIAVTGAGADITGRGVLNELGATISGGSTGLRVASNSDISGGVNNSGTISGNATTSVIASIAIALSSGSSISGGIDDSGIVSGNFGIGVSGNFGIGVSGNFGIGVYSGSDISGGIDNGGTISGNFTGIRILSAATISGGVDNSGTIKGGLGQVGILVEGGSDINFTNNPGLGVGVLNQAGGLISGGAVGIRATTNSNISGGVDNSGTISGGDTAINVEANSDLSGGVNNSGVVTGGFGGFLVGAGSDISGGVVNQLGGTISGGSVTGVILIANADISNGLVNNGTLRGGNAGLAVISSTLTGTVTNSGTLVGTNATGIGVVGNGGLPSDISGGVLNQVGGTVSGGITGIGVTVNSDISGGVDNSGVLSGGSLGLWVAGGSDVSDVGGVRGFGVLNRVGGMIDGAKQAIRVSGVGSDISGGVDNSGTLSGGRSGIRLFASSDLSGGVTNRGLITGGTERGISVFTNSDISGGVTNEVGGTISGLNQAIIVHKTSNITGGVDNAGLLSGGRLGLLVFENADISGAAGATGVGVRNQAGATITGVAKQAIRVRNGSDISGGVDNSGTLSGGRSGLRLFLTSDVSGGVTNGGLIKGVGARGIGVFTNADISGGVLNQVGGTISGLKNGMVVTKTSDISGGIDNHGLISGGRLGLLVIGNADISDAGGARGFGVLNRSVGTIAGIRVRTGSDISGGVDNRGTLRGVTIGVRVDATSQLSGGVANSGTIEGMAGPAIRDGDQALRVTNEGLLMGSGAVSVDLRGGDDRLVLKSGSTLVGNALGGAGVDAIRLAGTGSENNAFSGFESLEMNGADWGLSGAVTLLNGIGPGTATVTAGRLRVNGTLSAPGGVSVAAAGTLGGTGTVVGMVTNNGIVAPGNSLGTLSVTGDVAFAAGSSLAIEVDGTGVDLLDVDGNVTVDPAAVLDMTFAPGAVDVQGAVVTQATGSIDAAFATVTTNDTLVAVSLVGGNSLELDVVGVAAVNAAVAASAEEGFSFQNAVAGAQLSPRAPGSATPLWVRGVSEVVAAEGAAGTQQAISGVLFGGDVASFSGGDLRLGVAGGYVSSDAQTLVGTNSSAAEGLQAGTYGTYDLALPGGAAQLTFGLHGGYQTQETERAVVVGGTRTVGRGETQGSLMGGYLGASRAFALGEHMTLRPGARLGYLHQELEGYRDSAGLQVGALSADSLRFGPQVELSGDYRTAGGITFKPRGQVGWSQQVALDDRAVRLTLPSGAGGKVALDDGNAGSLNVAFGLDMVFEPGTSAYLSFDGTYGSDQTRTSAFAGVSFDLW